MRGRGWVSAQAPDGAQEGREGKGTSERPRFPPAPARPLPRAQPRTREPQGAWSRASKHWLLGDHPFGPVTKSVSERVPRRGQTFRLKGLCWWSLLAPPLPPSRPSVDPGPLTGPGPPGPLQCPEPWVLLGPREGPRRTGHPEPDCRSISQGVWGPRGLLGDRTPPAPRGPPQGCGTATGPRFKPL